MPWDDSLSAVHNDDTKIVGKSRGIPQGVNAENIPFGGHQSTALNAVNYVEVDWAAVERRNTSYIRENIANRRKREEDDKQKAQAASS